VPRCFRSAEGGPLREPESRLAADVANGLGSGDHIPSRELEMDQLTSAAQIEARPGAIVVKPCATALVVVDMQNDFASPGGMFDRAGIPIEGIQAMVEPIRVVLVAARAAGMKVVYLKMQFAADLSDAGPPDAPNRIKHRPLALGMPMQAPNGTTGRILVEGTWNTEVVEALAPEPDDFVVAKHRYSGFYETDLDRQLRGAGIDTLIFTGATTSVCVESTLRDAFYRDYRCLALSDCTAEPIGNDLSRGNHDASLLVIETLFGWVADSASLLTGLAAIPTAGAVEALR
jgi:ureidoacrylate peracid hydrolase